VTLSETYRNYHTELWRETRKTHRY